MCQGWKLSIWEERSCFIQCCYPFSSLLHKFNYYNKIKWIRILWQETLFLIKSKILMALESRIYDRDRAHMIKMTILSQNALRAGDHKHMKNWSRHLCSPQLLKHIRNYISVVFENNFKHTSQDKGTALQNTCKLEWNWLGPWRDITAKESVKKTYFPY